MSNTIDTSKLNANQLFAVPFYEYLSGDIPLNNTVMNLISQHCELVTFEKGCQMLDVGSDCRYIYFILSGESISYFTDFNGKTTTWFFHFNSPEATVKNIFAVDYKSFLAQTPATISIETLSDVTAIRFSREDLRCLTESSKLIDRWIRVINERAFIMIYDRISTLLTLSATERYKKFLEDEPYLLNMFSNYYIASYLDVAPQSLSRIRKNL
jgi:CRP-like cAMP-binding protein